MSWLRGSPLRASIARSLAGGGSAGTLPPAPAPQADPSVCFDTFRQHCHQVRDIIQKAQGTNSPSQDDVLGVVSHLGHIITLLLLEIRNNSINSEKDESFKSGFDGVCLEHLLSENLFDKLYEWGRTSGRYINPVRLEQLKLYSLLITHSGQQLLCAEPFLKPLLKLLCSFRTEILPEEVEGRLVCLLGQLCVVLMQKTQFVDLFFFPPLQENIQHSSFVPIALLMTYVHREGSLGQQARAALLLCAAISAKNQAVADFISKRSNVCPLLATGLSGLYSLLPRNIDVTQADWHRLTPDDVNDIKKLGLFMNSLEFCNAVAQVSHPSIRQQLLDFFYQGFLLPVMGPALLQKKRGQSTTRPPCLQSGVDEQIAAIAYLELAFRSVSEPGLMKSLIQFLMDKNYDGLNILETVIPFLNGDPRLSVVTISLLETLIDLNCEDLMIELVLKYLINGNHIMVSHRNKSVDCDLVCKATDMFLSLSPNCCSNRPQHTALKDKTGSSRKPSISSMEQNMTSLSSIPEQPPSLTSRDVAHTTIAYGLNISESLYGNYHAYLCDARRKILSCKKACSLWSSKYENYCDENTNSDDKLPNLRACEYDTNTSNVNDITIYKEEDSLHSIGESSGYESFKYKNDEVGNIENESFAAQNENKDFAETSFWKNEKLLSPNQIIPEKDHKSDTNGQLSQIDIGLFLNIIFENMGKMLSNNIYVNLRLTGLISRLATYPLPILRTLLLSPWIVLQPTVPSLYQILVTLKQQIDDSILNEPDGLLLVEEAQTYLIDREIRLANTRKNAIESTSSKNQNNSEMGKNASLTTQFHHQTVTYHNSGDASSSLNPDQSSTMQPLSIYEPFRRNESKRKSLSSSITSMFSRKLNSGAISTSPSNSQQQNESINLISNDALLSAVIEDKLWHSTPSRKIILNALILDEWLKELAALAQEHTVCSMSELLKESTVDLLNTANFQTNTL